MSHTDTPRTSGTIGTVRLRSHEEVMQEMFPPETRPVNIHESIDRALAVMVFKRQLAKQAHSFLVQDAQELGIYDE
jgi:hypothetical protein